MGTSATVLSKEEIQTRIAKRVAQELEHNTLVNLGIGLPTKVANYIPEGVNHYPAVRKWFCRSHWINR